ncbi:MAG: hypothetical protein KatS3mg054_0160 [Chloroflexus sp.]|nr:MAG: hypothetical protein KatS3mg054_0160 [Chloroflexus sp.]
MAKKYLANAFSLNMVAFPAAAEYPQATVHLTQVPVEMARELAAEAESIVGHEDTARIFSDILGRPVEFRRASVALQPGDTVLVGQYSGPRLPEGSTSLPAGAKITWIVVQVM